MIKSRGAGENAGKKTGGRLFTFFAIIIAAVSAVRSSGSSSVRK